MATVALDCAVAGNEARAGEYLAGAYLAGYDPVRFVAGVGRAQEVVGGIAGASSVGSSLSVTRPMAATVVGSSAVASQLAPLTGLAATVSGASALVAQETPFRGLAVPVAGASVVNGDLRTSLPLAASISRQAAVSADIIRVGVIRDLACWIGTPSSAPSFSPDDIPGLAFWLDATQDTFPNGSDVPTYTDHSPAGRQLVASTPAVYRAGAKPYLEFALTGTSGYIASAPWNAGGDGITYMAVVRIEGGSFPMMLVWGPDANGIEMRHDGSALQAVVMYSSYGCYFSSTNPSGGGVDHLYEMRVDAGVSNSLYSDGVLTSGPVIPAMDNVAQTMYVGRREGGYQFYGRMYEALVYEGAISETDRALLESYLQTKWGLVATARIGADGGKAVVAPSMTVANANFVSLDADVQGKAAVAAQDVKTVSFGCAVAGQASLAADTVVGHTISFGCTVSRAAAVVADTTVTARVFTDLAAAVTGKAVVSADTTITTIGKTISFAITIPSTPGIDPDTQAFMVASGLDPSYAPALDGLVVGLKAKGLWTKMRALYPFIGGTADLHKWNLKDPRDLDAAYRLTFTGPYPTHSTTGGYQANPAPDYSLGWADTHLVPAGTLDPASVHLSLYSLTTLGAAPRCDMGNYNWGGGGGRFHLIIHYTSGEFYYSLGHNGTPNVPGGDGSGLFVSSRTAVDAEAAYKDGASSGGNAAVPNALPPASVLIGSLNDYNARECSDTRFGFASIGDGLSAANVADLYAVVQSFQTALGRNVGPGVALLAADGAKASITSDLNIGKAVSFSASVAGQAVIGPVPTVSRLVDFSVHIGTTETVCGNFLCGTRVIGGAEGPRAVVLPTMNKGTSLSSDVSGRSNVTVQTSPSRGLSVEVGGQAQVLVGVERRLNLSTSIVGKAEVVVRINLDWLGPTTPADILLPPTRDVDWILTPTDEEEWLLVPTTERTM